MAALLAGICAHTCGDDALAAGACADIHGAMPVFVLFPVLPLMAAELAFMAAMLVFMAVVRGADGEGAVRSDNAGCVELIEGRSAPPN
eukprot:476357-Rhodomonas_salina.1